MKAVKPSAAKFSFWWLHPASIFGAVCGVTLLMAYWQAGVGFELYRTLKYVDTQYVLLGMLFILVFAGGSYLASETTPKKPPRPWKLSVLRKWFYVSLGLTFFGYLVWLAVGVKNGVTPGLLVELMRADDTELWDGFRETYFPTIPGVTTCTQFGLAAILLGTLLYVSGDRTAGKWLVGLFIVGLARAAILSERMALIELVLPSFILAIRLAILAGRSSPRLRTMGRLLPIVAPLTLAIVFGGFEYFRSWQYYVNDFDSYPQFVVWRLTGYYTTAHNNGAMALATQQPRPLPYFTVEALWEFPGVDKSPFGYERLTSINVADNHVQMLENFGNPELNNEGGLIQPLIDWGLPLSIVFWLAFGFVATRAYKYFLEGHLGGILFYPIIFLALTDIPRLLLLSDPRLTPSIAFLTLAVFSSKAETEPAS